MHVKHPFKIIGSGIFLPGDPVDNKNLEARYGVPENYSWRRSGVKQRYIAEKESGSEMGAKALLKAMEAAEVLLEDIDLLISAGASFDYIIPNQAVIIKSMLPGSKEFDFPVMTVNSVCSGFITALDTASKLMDGKEYKTVAIVNSEISHRYINPDNYETASLFGDAATAVIIRYDMSNESGMIHSQFKTYSAGAYFTIIEGGGNQYPARDYPFDKVLHGFKMDGLPLLKMAKKCIPEYMKQFFEDLPIEITEVDFILAHQASKTGFGIFSKMYDFKESQIRRNLAKYGNCISASIPLLLHELKNEGKMEKNKLVLLSGTSAGFSISGILIRI